MIEIKELLFNDSQEYLRKFQRIEKSYGADWYGCEDPNATYIWLIENIKNPLGLLSYKVLILPNRIDFVHIMKIYALQTHRGKNPILIEEERVSEILFREIDSKNVDILILESSCEKLDIYYKSLGFEYNKEISQVFGKEIGITEPIMHRQKKDTYKDMPDELKELFIV